MSIKSIILTLYLNKFGPYINFLLQLNKIKLNLLLLLLLYCCLFITLNKLNLKVGLIFSFAIKSVYINFIQLFIYGFFKIHIILFYTFSIISLCLSWKCYYVNLKWRYHTIIFWIIISFLLGSLWSLYLFDWGYYWTNDSIEYLLLLLILYQLIIVHVLNSQKNMNYIIIWLVVITLTAIRLNFIYTRHNFFKSESLSYFSVKYVWVVYIQSYILLQKTIKYIITNYRLSLILILSLVGLILCNTINYFTIKLSLYSLYSISFVYSVLLNNWGKLKYIYIHLIAFIVYANFVMIGVCYLFILKVSDKIKIMGAYNFFFYNYTVVINKFYNLYNLKMVTSDLVIFNKNGLKMADFSNINFLKKLINFLN